MARGEHSPVKWWTLLFFCSAAVAGQTIAPGDPISVVEGRVVHGVTGEAVRKARVMLVSRSSGEGSEMVATTDDAGHFRFADVSTGSYKLVADKIGFLAGAYGESKPEAGGRLLRINADDHPQSITLQLFPAGAISGRILDLDGDAIAGRNVVLWSRKRRMKGTPNSPVDETTANRAGEFRFDGLSPGTYFVSAGADSSEQPANTQQTFVDSDGKATKLRELRTFYPSAVSIAEAQSIHIESGQEQTGADIRVRRGPLLIVQGRVAGTNELKSDYHLSATLDDGMGWTSKTGKLLPDGEFTFDGLPPGSHRLSLSQYSAGGPKEIGVTTINLTDENLSGVVITPFKPAQVRVRVVVEGAEDKPLTAGSVFLTPIEENGNARQGTYQFEPQNGIYSLKDVAPGTYQIGFTNAGKSYLKSVESGGRLLAARSIEIADSASLDLLLTYGRNVASVSGEVDIPRDEARDSVHVFLIEENKSATSSKSIEAELDQTFHFSIGERPPGKYVAFAAQEGDFDVWNNAQFLAMLQAEGSNVELHENDHATLHLKLIPRETTDRIRQQLGI